MQIGVGTSGTAAAAEQASASAAIALAYHARTRHELKRYAAGPETLDWDAQPNPFREFTGCLRTPLPLTSERVLREEGYNPAALGKPYAPLAQPAAP